MSKRMLKSDDVDGFMMAVWDEWVDTEKLYGCRILVDMRRQESRGRYTFVALAMSGLDSEAVSVVGQAEAQWPSHKYTSLHACLLNLLSRLNISVQNYYRETEGTYYSSPTD